MTASLRATALALIALALTAPATAQVPKDTVQVVVTLSGTPAPGVRVKAIGEPPGGGEVGYGEAVTGPDGTASFSVPYRPGLQMKAVAFFDGVRYTSAKVDFGEDPKVGVRLDLAVYPKAQGDVASQLAFGPGSHVIIEVTEGALSVSETFKVMNMTGRTVAPEGGLLVPLPKGFSEVKGTGGADVQTREHLGAAVAGPFLPGDTDVTVRFKLPYSGTEVDFRQALSLPMQSARVIVDESPNLRIAGDGVRSQDAVESEGRRFRRADLAILGDALAFRLEGLPHQSNTGRWYALGLSVAILVGGIFVGVGGRRDGGRAAATKRAAQSERDALLADLEQLEHDHRQGEVGDADYAEDRREILGRLADALRTLEGPGR